MNTTFPNTDDNTIDDHVDSEIYECLKLTDPKSFFLFAGAGSGKTRSLVKVLDRLCKEYSKQLQIQNKRVAVITYTNAACDEIKKRLDFNPLIEVATIHSFVWALIQGYNLDIKVWVKTSLEQSLNELKEAQAKGRTGTKAYSDRDKEIKSKSKKLELLPTIKKFIYNPNGDNKGKASLNHADVIKIGAEFLTTKPLMQLLLITKFPILLIDESQDTNKLLMEAFLKVQSQHTENFALGLIGDTMQRIYSDGKIDLGINLPDDWAKPVKVMNHRCPKRVVTLINKIRSEIDSQQQRPRSDSQEGFIRLFIVPRSFSNKMEAEKLIAKKMSGLTTDDNWEDLSNSVKVLILEHHMAANRMGFVEMFEPLYKQDTLKTGLLDGSLRSLKLFTEQILPIIEGQKVNNSFKIMSIIRKYSPFLSPESLKSAKEDQTVKLKEANKALQSLLGLWKNGKDPKLIDIVNEIHHTKLFDLSETLNLIASRTDEEKKEVSKEVAAIIITGSENEQEDKENMDESVISAWDNSLQAPFSQIKPYHDYITGNAGIDTHQGVKGLEFERVLVIIDDEEARGFMFSYDKLFGTKGKSESDIKNEQQNLDTSQNRTRRLFYVTCSRAEKSLAIVAYADNPDLLKNNVIQQNWFSSDEVEILK